MWLDFTLAPSCVRGHRPVRLQVQSQAITTTSGRPFSSCLGLLGQLRIVKDSDLGEPRALNRVQPRGYAMVTNILITTAPNSRGRSKRTNKPGLQNRSMGNLGKEAKTTVFLPRWLMQRDLHSEGQDFCLWGLRLTDSSHHCSNRGSKT